VHASGSGGGVVAGLVCQSLVVARTARLRANRLGVVLLVGYQPLRVSSVASISVSLVSGDRREYRTQKGEDAPTAKRPLHSQTCLEKGGSA